MTNQIEFKYVDATPDEDYPLRILESYRDSCNWMWSDNSQEVYDPNKIIQSKQPENPLIKAMNDAQRKRAEILDRAIAKLKEV